MVSGKKLIATESALNLIEGLLSLAYKNEGLVSYVDSNPPQIYYQSLSIVDSAINMNGSFAEFNFAPVSSAQFIRFDSDGHMSGEGQVGNRFLIYFVGKFRPQLIKLTNFKSKLLIRFIMNEIC